MFTLQFGKNVWFPFLLLFFRVGSCSDSDLNQFFHPLHFPFAFMMKTGWPSLPPSSEKERASSIDRTPARTTPHTTRSPRLIWLFIYTSPIVIPLMISHSRDSLSSDTTQKKNNYLIIVYSASSSTGPHCVTKTLSLVPSCPHALIRWTLDSLHISIWPLNMQPTYRWLMQRFSKELVVFYLLYSNQKHF